MIRIKIWLYKLYTKLFHGAIDLWLVYKRSAFRSRVLFCFHSYPPQAFDPGHAKGNILLLMKRRHRQRIGSTFQGELHFLESSWARFKFWLKNSLLLGAFQSQLQRVIDYSFVTFTLEVTNPLDRNLLRKVVGKKREIVGVLAPRVSPVNGRFWDPDLALGHLDLYVRGSIVQERVIERIEKATYRARGKAKKLIERAEAGMAKGFAPILLVHGTSGAYWMRGEKREILGIFKPYDEEMLAPNNPVGSSSQGVLGHRRMRAGIRVGESIHREAAAFFIDDYFGFGLVPKTTYATFTHSAFYSSHLKMGSRVAKKKMGSFQVYVEGLKQLTKCSRAEMEALDPVEWQLLILLDVILGNTDRNTGNILVQGSHLVAVDHSLSLPDRNLSLSYWYWSRFKQSETTLIAPLRELLENFPFEELSRKLIYHFLLDREVMSRMKERLVLFREAVRAGLTLAKIEPIMSVENLGLLENLDLTLEQKAQEIVQTHIAQSTASQ